MQLQTDFLSNTQNSTSRIINTEPIHVSQSTFKAGLANRIHRWFRLTPSFGPDLVHEMLQKMGARKGHTILDPFSGAGTTAIEAQLEGFNCVAFEVNPLLHFVGSTSLDWSFDADLAQNALDDVLREATALIDKVEPDQLVDQGYFVPPIHNVHRWWRADVLRDLCVLVHCLERVSNNKVREFLRLSLAGVLVPDLTNVTLGKLQLHFIDRSDHVINALSSYRAHTERMIDDLTTVRQQSGLGSSVVLHQDSTDLKDLKLTTKIDHVITSPPYPNRYSYVWNTRPHLYLLRFMEEGKAAADLDKKTIGGTWGTATSVLQKGTIEPLNAAVDDVVSPIVAEIRRADNLMANYCMHYFNKLTQQIVELNKITSPNVKLAYVVGNSRLKGVYVETDSLLANILEKLEKPYAIREIHRFRRRNSGVDLFESIVYASR